MPDAFLDATAQADLVRRGEVSPTELVQEAVTRIEKLNPELNAVIHPLFERAGIEAAGELPNGPFRGVPMVLKDLDAMLGGAPLHYGTRYLRDRGYIADHDTHLVRRFRDAGFVIVGKTNTPELGLVPTTEPEVYGPTRNPWDPARSPGGSSGGSAAAVASGMVAVGHAGDGGGSIRIPASECGLVGLKPSRGRVSLGPDVDESWAGMVARLAVTRSVRDTAAILDALSGEEPGDPYVAPVHGGSFAAEVGADPGRLRVGLLTAAPIDGLDVDPVCAEAVEETGRLLSSLGHDVSVLTALPGLDDPGLVEAFFACFSVWVAADLDDMAAKGGEPVRQGDVEHGTWELAEVGRTITGLQFQAGLDGMNRYRRAVAAWWAAGNDVLLTPTIPFPPPLLGRYRANPDDPMAGGFMATATVAFTLPFNVTGQPAISLPLHTDAAGVPVGVQLVGAYGREDVLLRVSAQLEQAAPWSARRPVVSAS
jgi:amidase